MSIIRYVMLFQLLIAAFSIIKFFMTPLEEMITIQLAMFYMLITWSIFGIIYITKFLDEDFNKMIKGK